MANRNDFYSAGCVVVILAVILGLWFAGCYAWVKSVHPVQIQVPRD